MASQFSSISIDSIVITTATANPSISSMNLSYPLTSISSSMHMLHSNYPLTLLATSSTAITCSLINESSALEIISYSVTPTLSAERQVAVEAHLGLRDGSLKIKSERLPWEQAKGEIEIERHAISSISS